MYRRREFRDKIESEHRPRYSPVRFVVFLAALLVCGATTYLIASRIQEQGESNGAGFDLRRLASPDQLALEVYLLVRQGDIEWRSPGSGDVTFEVQRGDTPATIGARLEKLGMVQDADLFRQVARARGVERKLEAGDFTLRRGMSMDEILQALQHGVTRSNTAVITEGKRIEEIAQALERQSIVRAADFIAAARAGSYTTSAIKDLPAGSTLEGFLFPDTYQLPRDATAPQIVSTLLANFDKKVPPDLWSRSNDLRLTPYQLLVVASIVEREAVVPDERPRIAGVYLNRLRKGMRLEADPTVQYAMGYQAAKDTWWKTPVQLEEYSRVDSPYNTYLRAGLPPTPICSPGISSIRAAFDPEKSDFLFFLARGDGSHVFAKTFEEHQANIIKYQR